MTEPEPGSNQMGLPAEPRLSPVGICVSGGGLRAASFGLGALQALQAHRGLLKGGQSADFLSAVSGGSYIAGAYAMVAQGPYGRDDIDAGVVSPSNPFEPGSAEERHIRNNTRYLIDGVGGTIGTILLALQRLITMLGVLFVFIFTAVRPLGWLYRWIYPALACPIDPKNDCAVHPRFDISLNPVVVAVFLCIAAAGLVVAMIAVVRQWGRSRRAINVAAVILILVGLIGLAAIVGLPELLAWWQRLRSRTRSGLLATKGGAARDAIVITGALLAAMLIASLSLRTSQPKRSAKLPGPLAAIRRALAGIRGPLLNGLAAFAGPAVFGGVALRVMAGGATKGINGTTLGFVHDWQLLTVSAAIVMLAIWQGDVVQWSLHPVYRRRIGNCFAIARTNAPHDVIRRDPETVYALSKTRPAEFPELIISAAVNVSDRGQTPAGTRVLPFIFTPNEIGIPGLATFNTGLFERSYQGQRRGLLGRNVIVDSPTGRMRISLPSAIAATGAAVSPAMGKMTRAPQRFLIAMFNLRLGVWLPNPTNSVMADAVSSQGAIDRVEDRKALRSWPGPPYLFAEMLGLNTLKRKFIYVSDGGHYENLGIMELLRRRCSTIWCIDASGDPPGSARTLAEAIGLARAELDVEIEIDVQAFALADSKGDPLNRLVLTNVAEGRIRYSDGTAGQLIVIKLGLSADDPSDLIQFQRHNPSFPYDSTGNQIYRAERFDAYRALGYHAAARSCRRVGTDVDQSGFEAAR